MSEPPRVRAYLSWALPALAWVSQIFVALFLHGAFAEVYCCLALGQLALVVAGLVLGISVLSDVGSGSRNVTIPAIVGVTLSTLSILLNIAFIARYGFA